MYIISFFHMVAGEGIASLTGRDTKCRIPNGVPNEGLPILTTPLNLYLMSISVIFVCTTKIS
jgi:hypothetical protein